jgi:DNA replication protein DnaC
MTFSKTQHGSQSPSSGLPSSLERAISRLARPHSPSHSWTASPCGVKATCSKCSPASKGVFLENDGVFIRASLCSCVAKCTLCHGICVTASLDDKRVMIPCTEPSPLKIVGLINDARIPGRYLDADLKKFSNFTGSGKQVISQIGRWIENFTPGKSSGLLLTGSVGVGKTYVLSAIAKALALRGISVRFSDFFQLVNELRESYSSDQKDPSVLRPLHEFDVLIIDELGKGRNSEWEISIADTLISERYNSTRCIIASTNYALTEGRAEAAQKQIDIWSTNTSQSNQMNTDQFETLIKRLGPRIYSRLKEMAVFLELTGSDFRKA